MICTACFAMPSCMMCNGHSCLTAERADHLSCAVLQVELFESAPEGAPVPEDELYQIVLAHMVHGMHTFSAAHLATADKMLAFLTSPPR